MNNGGVNNAQLSDFASHKIEGWAREGGKEFSVSLFSHIQGNLWTGGCPNPSAPKEFQFIVCLYPWEPYALHDHQIQTQAKLFDSGDVPDERLLYLLAQHVNECAKIGATLVHCQAGLNRSGLIAGLSLVMGGMAADEAIDLLRAKRCDAVLCNRAFERWLRERK